MDSKPAVYLLYQSLRGSPLLLHLRILQIHRIHVDHRLTAKALMKLHLRAVNGIVKGVNIAAAVHLPVEGNHSVTRTVVVHHQIVYSDNLRPGKHDFFDLVNKLRLRRLA